MNTTETPKKNKKITFIVILIVAIVAAIEIYFGFLQHHEVANNVKIDGVYLAQTKEIANFKLMDTRNKSFTKANLQGHWTLMFFGFTNCGMVCPTTMAALAGMYKGLEKELSADQLPQVVMVSVDPDRDTTSRLKEYVSSFNPSFIGVRAEISETIALEKQLHIAAAKLQVDGQGKNQYTINHSAEILMFNPKGQVQAYLSFPHKAEQLMKDYKLIVKTAN